MIKEMITLRNTTPTETEKQMYLYAGFYVIEKDYCEVNGNKTDVPYIKYAVCYTGGNLRETFPAEINIEKKHINYNEIITFNAMSEEMEIKGRIDTKILQLIEERAKELGWS